MKPHGKILVAMSGGVDSSVAAALLRQAGHDVVGVFMCLGSGPPAAGDDGDGPADHRSCCSPADAEDARSVALRLGIPLHVLDFSEPFGRLIDRFVAEYHRGRTPNPCVWCNSELKFGRLIQYADAVGADAVATGHYARIVQTAGGTRLGRGLDLAKDQSYVLFGVPARLLGRIVLPLGEWTKTSVRARAAELGLPVADKPDSQEICFVPDDDYAALLRRRSPEAIRPGPIVDASGRRIGTHPGHQHYTIGQRRGLGVALGRPAYVTHIDPAANAVTLGPADDLLRTELTCSDVNWLIAPAEASAFRAAVKIRYRAEPAPATVTPLAGGRAAVRFEQAVSAVTPGQAAVFYDQGGLVVGGGWIE